MRKLIWHLLVSSINFARVNFKTMQLRIAVRALLLLLVATCRGVYVTVEQPASSTMCFLPDFIATAKAVQQHLGIWQEQFLPDP
jgi:hypothetical protein